MGRLLSCPNLPLYHGVREQRRKPGTCKNARERSGSFGFSVFPWEKTKLGHSLFFTLPFARFQCGWVIGCSTGEGCAFDVNRGR